MFHTILSSTITPVSFILCLCASLVLGILAAIVFSVDNKYTSTWKIAIALLPAVVTAIIIMVSGSLGTGIAVAGTFALTRFRSMPGSAKEITGLFFAVSLGLICGMGYIGIAALYFILYAAVVLLLSRIRFGEAKTAVHQLRVTIPENLDFEEVFDDLFAAYTRRSELMRVKTTNMGSLFELTYEVELKAESSAKKMIDELRCRNGNLTVIMSRGIPIEEK